MFGDIMGLVWQLVVGLIVGVIARFLLPGKENFPAGALGWLLTALLGIAGAFIGTVVIRFIPMVSENYIAGWLGSIFGAILLLLVYRLIFGKGASAS